MSRAFVKEDDAGEPPIIPSRAALPPGTPNYVTSQGLADLRTELEDLEAERTRTDANHDDEANRTRQLSIINSRLNALTQRIASAKPVDPRNQPPDEVRFGATVTLTSLDKAAKVKQRIFQIVGVDEASVEAGKIAFVAPIARAVSGKKPGEIVTLRLGRQEEQVKISRIVYE